MSSSENTKKILSAVLIKQLQPRDKTELIACKPATQKGSQAPKARYVSSS